MTMGPCCTKRSSMGVPPIAGQIRRHTVYDVGGLRQAVDTASEPLGLGSMGGVSLLGSTWLDQR